jgi:MFS family permease
LRAEDQLGIGIDGPAAVAVDASDAVDPAMADLRDRLRADPRLPYGWRPVIVLMLVTLVDRVETSLVAGVLPLLQEEWGFGDTLGGAIPTAAAIAGILVTLPAGYLADRKDRRRLIAVVVAAWSVITMGSAVAVGFGMFFATRVVLGAADSLESPSASSLIADWYPPRTRARAYGLHRMVFFAGGSVGVLLGGLIGELLGWRAAFLAVVVPGALVAWMAHRTPEPPRGGVDRLVAAGVGGAAAHDLDGASDDAGEPVAAPDAADEHLAAAAALDGGLGVFREQLREILAVRTLRRVFAGLFALFVGIGGIIYWLPTFFDRVHDTGTGLGGTYTALVGLVGIVGGATLGGSLGDRWHGSRRGARVLLGGGGLVAGSVTLGVALLDLPLPARVPLLALSLLLLSIAIPNLTAAIADVLPADRRGAGFALLQLFLALGSAGGPLAVGAASDAAGSLTTAFAVLVAPMVVGSLVVLRARATFEADMAACPRP